MTSRRPILELAELTGPRELAAEAARHALPPQIGGDTPRPAGADRHQDRAAARRHHQPRRGQRRGAAQLDRIPRHPQGARRIMSAFRLETFAPASGAAPRQDRPARAPPRGRARGGLPRRLPRRPGGGDRGLPRRGGAADQRAGRGDRRRPADQRGGAPPRRRQPRADGRGAGAAIAPALADAGLGAEIARLVERALVAGPRGAAAAALRARARRPHRRAAGRSAASRPASRRRRSCCRARRRSSGTRATTISISTPASRRSAPASRRISGTGSKGEDDDPRRLG